jgi:hypothetical protein
MNSCQKEVRKATSLTGKAGRWRISIHWLLCGFIFATLFSLLVFGCDLSGSREAKKMDENIVSPSIGTSDTAEQSGALIPPIDLMNPPQINTATFALG